MPLTVRCTMPPRAINHDTIIAKLVWGNRGPVHHGASNKAFGLGRAAQWQMLECQDIWQLRPREVPIAAA
jgi:hypothetical protein